MPDAMNNIINDSNAESQYHNLADLLGMYDEFVSIHYEDFVGMDEIEDYEDMELRVSFLTFKPA
jgi:hypothetical protein